MCSQPATEIRPQMQRGNTFPQSMLCSLLLLAKYERLLLVLVLIPSSLPLPTSVVTVPALPLPPNQGIRFRLSSPHTATKLIYTLTGNSTSPSVFAFTERNRGEEMVHHLQFR